MIDAARGTAMAETAIVLTTALLVIFGIMQIAIWGYNQASTEGAAFVAAHSASVNSSGSQATDEAYGKGVANLAFPGMTSSLTLSYPTSNSIQVIASKAGIGVPFRLPGVPGTATVRGGDIEPILSNIGDGTLTSSGFAAQATLANYCAFSTRGKTTTSSCTTRSIYLTQYDDIYGKGNGKNGQFAEWNCRPALFPAWGGTYFPTTMPTTGGSNSPYDPGGAAFGESGLYQMDTTPNKWGTEASC